MACMGACQDQRLGLSLAQNSSAPPTDISSSQSHPYPAAPHALVHRALSSTTAVCSALLTVLYICIFYTHADACQLQATARFHSTVHSPNVLHIVAALRHAAQAPVLPDSDLRWITLTSKPLHISHKRLAIKHTKHNSSDMLSAIVTPSSVSRQRL